MTLDAISTKSGREQAEAFMRQQAKWIEGRKPAEQRKRGLTSSPLSGRTAGGTRRPVLLRASSAKWNAGAIPRRRLLPLPVVDILHPCGERDQFIRLISLLNFSRMGSAAGAVDRIFEEYSRNNSSFPLTIG